ncbi:IS1595 family transposase [Azospirillum sp. A1-3]|uniref:IS1595 family transposase n=1 Tax=Azospirillum sp. A1-3 TaxID=185874 RepID=UPI002076E371|nr:IS1595 family transposase [Azospirillum sp. A1-3]MCM8738524.1 IS1595 family transposase [Azospirillum sp. A1-3]
MIDAALTLRAFNDLFPDEEAARAWFERARWPDGPVCPVCGCVDHACWLKTIRRWECTACRRQFSVTAGTPMHRTHLPLLTWAQAIYLIVASSKGISAVKLAEMLGVSYETAWHLGHRIRAMMAEQNTLLSGIVEIDETYAGAPPRKRAKPERKDDDRDPPPPNPKGRGTKRPLLLVAAERGGDVVTKVIPTHGKAAVAEALSSVLDADAVAMTDGLPAYKHLGAARTHLSVNHSQREYARTDEATGHRVHVNRVESFNGFLGRAVVGVFHFVSPKHLGRYAGEAAFRWNRKAEACLERMARLVRNGVGRTLPYGFLTGAA